MMYDEVVPFNILFKSLVDKKFKNFTNTNICKHIGISRTFLYQIMNNERIPSYFMLEVFSTYFNIDINTLLKSISYSLLERYKKGKN